MQHARFVVGPVPTIHHITTNSGAAFSPPGGHGHSDGRSNERAVGIAALLTGSFMLAEIAGGLISGSLALLADAGHMLTDFASLVLAWFAFRFARRPATWRRTYGFDRLSVLAAFVNGLSLFAIAVWITIEAFNRLFEPGELMGDVMLWIAVAGLAVNVLAFWVLTRGEGDNLNVRAAALHVTVDLLGSVAAIVAAVVILWTGWTPIDPILSVLVVLIILRSAWKVVRESGHMLLEGTPQGFACDALPRFRRQQVEQLSATALSTEDVLLEAGAFSRRVTLLQYRIPDRLAVLKQRPVRLGGRPTRFVLLLLRVFGRRLNL